MRLGLYICCVLLLVGIAACQPTLLDKALKGKLPPEEGNTVITEYCQSCHIHRAFDPAGHTPRVQTLYDRAPYTTATSCRTCHLVYEDAWKVKYRKTLWPAQAARGKKLR